MKRFTAVLIVLLFSISVFSMPPFHLDELRNGYQVHITIPELKVEHIPVHEKLKSGKVINETFTKISIPGFAGKGVFGDPELLTSSFQLALENDNIEIAISDIVCKEVILHHNIYPVQPIVYETNRSEYFAYNPEAYTKRGTINPYFVTISDRYVYRGQHAASIEFNPVQYNPLKKVLTVARSFTVTFKMAKPTIIKSMGSPSFDKQMRKMFQNLKGELGRGIPSERFSGKEKYLIISSSTYADNADLQKLIDFRSTTYEVELVTPSDIGSSKDDYRDYVRGIMPTFCLLVGKYGDFPTHSYSSTKSYNYYVAPTTGKPKPDIALGLFFVRSAQSLTNIVEKTISAETTIDTYPRHFVAFGGNTQSMGNLPPNHCDVILREMYDDYFVPMGEWDITECYQVNQPRGGKEECIAAMNKGVRFINYNGHGMTSGWTYGNGSWRTTDIGAVSNTIYPFVLSCACQTGNFTSGGDCWAEKWIGHENLGAAFIGAQTTAYTSMHGFNRGVMKAVTEEELTRFGMAYTRGVCYTYDTVSSAELVAWQFHYFGDPAVETMKSPQTLTLTSPNGGEEWERGQSYDITWTTNTTDNIKVEIINGTSVQAELAGSVSPNDAYTWSIPADFPLGDEYKIRVTSVTQSSLTDESDDFFTVKVGTGIAQKGITMPASLDLKLTATGIHFQIPENNRAKQLSIKLYSLRGDLVRTVVNGPASPGYHRVQLNTPNDACNLAAGLYLCRMKTKGFSKTITVLLKR